MDRSEILFVPKIQEEGRQKDKTVRNRWSESVL